MVVAGPIDAMMSVRTESQIERNDNALSLLADIWNSDEDTTNQPNRPGANLMVAKGSVLATNRDLRTKAWLARQQFGQAKQQRKVEAKPPAAIKEHERASAQNNVDNVVKLKVIWTEFVYDPNGEDHDAPLSWKLTKHQQERIETFWGKATGKDYKAGNLQEPPLKTIERFFDPVSKD
jgi:hypothetical protein